MDVRATEGKLRFFRDLRDPRAKNVVHKPHDIVVLAVCGVIAGAGGWVEVEMFAGSRLAWFKSFLDLPGGVPSHDTFGRAFAALGPRRVRTLLHRVGVRRRHGVGRAAGVDRRQGRPPQLRTRLGQG